VTFGAVKGGNMGFFTLISYFTRLSTLSLNSLKQKERKVEERWAARAALSSIRKIYTLISLYMQYFYTKLDIRKASLFIIIPNLADIEFGHENSINFMTNIIFYGTLLFILYKINKNFATLVYIGSKYPVYKSNIILNIAVDYFNIMFYTIFLLVSISFLCDFTYLVSGELLDRSPLHYSRLFKMSIAFALFMVNIAIKKLSGEKLIKWDILKFVLLFTPIIIQTLMAYGVFTSLIQFLTSLVAFSSYLYNDFDYHSLKESIKTWIKDFFKKMPKILIFGDEIGEFDRNKKCKLPEKSKTKNIDAMNTNSGGFPNAELSSGSGNGGGNDDNWGNDKGKERESKVV
jgi:hypothetical protein